MKFLQFTTSLLLSTLLTYTIGIYTVMPWYSFVFTNFVIALVIPQAPWKSFLSGGLGVGILWLALAININNSNAQILAIKVAQILPLKGNVAALLALTTFVGFLVGGLASLSASFIRSSKN